MRALFTRIVDFFSSMGLSCVLLILLALLTWLGTLEQVHSGLFEVQKKYFESFFLVHRAGPIPIVLPGANLVLWTLAANLLVGGLVRLRRGWSMAGVFVTHVGILMLLVASFVKLQYSDDGHMTLYEGERSNVFQSYYRWEVVVTEPLEGDRVKEHIIPQEDFQDAAKGPRPVRFTSPELPFDLELRHFMKNSRPMPKGPMFEVAVPVVDGAFLQARSPDKTAERNVAGLYVDVVEPGGERQTGLLWGAGEPLTVEVGGERWALDLRHERYPLPFTVALDDFQKEEHPRTAMPSWFSSDVTVVEDGSERPVTISMNEPLRDRGFVLYQASWGPSNAPPGTPLFSTLSVVRNPADKYPLYSLAVIVLGLALHFGAMLIRYVRLETSKS